MARRSANRASKERPTVHLSFTGMRPEDTESASPQSAGGILTPPSVRNKAIKDEAIEITARCAVPLLPPQLPLPPCQKCNYASVA